MIQRDLNDGSYASYDEPAPSPVLTGREDRCQVHLVHADKSEAQCILVAGHLGTDDDHRDEHGHTAPVLVHRATIEEVARVSRAASVQALTVLVTDPAGTVLGSVGVEIGLDENWTDAIAQAYADLRF